mgnify:CR=1 FL=1
MQNHQVKYKNKNRNIIIMIVRIILFILLIKYYKQIYDFLLKNNLFSLDGFASKIENTVNKVTKTLTTNELKKQMLVLKSINKNTYKEVNRRIKNIDRIYKNIFSNKDIKLKNEYLNIKEERKKIKNRIKSINVSNGINNDINKIIRVIQKYIDDLLQNILDERDRRGINTEWFEGTLYETVSDYDPNTNYMYDYFVK